MASEPVGVVEEREESREGQGAQTETPESIEEKRRGSELRLAPQHARQPEAVPDEPTSSEGHRGGVAPPPPTPRYPIREIHLTLPRIKDPVVFNPVVTLIGLLCLWSLVVWCSVNPMRALDVISPWRLHVLTTFTWLFQGTKALTFFFILYITYRYGHLQMGRLDETPEFSTLLYVSTVFTTGSGVALLVFCVPQPLSISYASFFANAGYRSQDEVDMFAINATVVDWGVAGWSRYTLVAVAMSLATHRFHLPLTYRSCFYPILGAYTWGWIGDAIDGATIIATVASIFSSLGLGVLEIVNGIQRMGWIDPNVATSQIKSIEASTLWVILIIAFISVLFGLNGGTPILSGTAMMTASVLLVLVFVMEDAPFLLNLLIQELGYYVQTGMFQLNFWTDAFGQVTAGAGRAIDGRAAEPWWMSAWFDLSQVWWIATAAPVGMFIARLSRGRKLWEIVLYSLAAPVGFCLVWFCVWGGVGLRQSRQSIELQVLGEIFFNSSDHFRADGLSPCFDVPQEDLIVNETLVFTNHLPGITPVCQFDPENFHGAVFNVLYSFSFPETTREGGGDISGRGLGHFLSFLFITACALFFAAIADCASVSLDNLSSNGRAVNQQGVCRVFWILSIGALSTALLIPGGSVALGAVQGSIVLLAVPFAILLCYVVQSATLFCEAAELLSKEIDAEYKVPKQPEFRTPVYGGVFNGVEYLISFGRVDASRVILHMHRPSWLEVTEFVKGVFVPFVPLYQVLSATHPRNVVTNVAVAVAYMICYLSWIGLLAASHSHAWVAFALCSCILTSIRSQFRSLYNIRSNSAGDLIASTFFWPQVLVQMQHHLLLTVNGPDEARTL